MKLMTPEQLQARVQAVLPSVLDDLIRMVKIPSVSADPARADQVQASAELVAHLCEQAGMQARITAADGGAPAVIAHRQGPAGAPRVLLYAHHDVQPENDLEDWDTPPFEPTQVGERLYARGAADDKAGIAAHLAAIRALGDELPVTVTMFVEGEEEIGSASLPALLAQEKDALAADVIVIADSANWAVGEPALTTSLRGLVRVDVTVRTLTHAVHSGLWGGVVPDALMALSRLLASLHDDAGNVAVAGLKASPAADVEYPPARLRAESGAIDTLELIGSGTVVERLWTKPALSIIGIDAPAVEGASNTLHPTARARLALRTSPADNVANAAEKLVQHLKTHAPWGAQVDVEVVDVGEATQLEATGPAYDVAREAFTIAWDGVAPIDMGIGGSIPFISEFLAAYPQASVLVTGVEDPDTRAHGANESLHLGEFERVAYAEALLLVGLAQRLEGTA